MEIIGDIFKCVFGIMLVVSIAGGFVYFVDILREVGIASYNERLRDIESRLNMCEDRLDDLENDDDDQDDEGNINS